MAMPMTTFILLFVSTTTFFLFETTTSNPIIHPNPPTIQPLCISQFALANHACASIPAFPFIPSPGRVPVVPPPPPTGLLSPSLVNSPSPLVPSPNTNTHHTNPPAQTHHHHHHHHQARPENHHEREVHEHEHEHEHHHHHHHRRAEETEVQKECCKWLRAVDDMCVCDLLVYLPVFLSRPAHGFTVNVDDECEVRFECLGRRLLQADPKE